MPPQRLSESAIALSTSAGTAVFNFPAPPTNLVWIGTLVLLAAPTGAAFSATVAGTPWCSWAGPSIGGPVQALPGEVVQITATGLAASTSYTLQWIGRSNSLNETTPQYPDTNSGAGGVVSQPPGSALTVLLQGGASQAIKTNASATTVQLLNTPAAGLNWLLHNATFTLGSGATAAQIVGNSTGFVYAQMLNAAETFFPMMGQIAAEALNFTTVGGGGSVWLSYDTNAPGTGTGGGVAFAFQLSHSYSVVGVLGAQTLPPFFIPVIAGQTAIIESVRTQLQSGTSISLALQQNGTNIPGLGAISVTTAATNTNPTSPTNLANNDAVQAILSSPVGNPTGLSVSFYVQYT